MNTADGGSDVLEEVAEGEPVRSRPPRRGPRVAVADLIGVGIGVAAFVALVVVVASNLSLGGWGGFGEIGPGTGEDSQRLDVTVSPTEDLTDGATVFVSSRAFRPIGVVGVALCLDEALTEEDGVDACDTDAGQRFAVDADGELAAVIAVPRVITVAGEPHDCAERAGRCLVVAADSNDFDLSGGQPVTFAPDLGAADLEPADERPRSVLLPGTLTPDGPVAAGTTVTVEASGFMPGEPVIVGRCTSAFLHVEAWEACTPAGDDADGAVRAIMIRTVDGIALHADEQGAVRTEVVVGSTVTPGLGGDEAAGFDCTAEADACAVVVAAAADTQRSAYLPLAITP